MEERPPCFLKSPQHKTSKKKRKQNGRFLLTLSEGCEGLSSTGRDSEPGTGISNCATENTHCSFLPTTSVHPLAPRRMRKIRPVPSHLRPHSIEEICQKHEVKSTPCRQLTPLTRQKKSNHRYVSADQTNDTIHLRNILSGNPKRFPKSANQCSVNITGKKLQRASQFVGKEVLSKEKCRKQNSYSDLELPRNKPLQIASASKQSIIGPALFDKSVLCKALNEKVKSGVVVESPMNLTSRNLAFQQILKNKYGGRDILLQSGSTGGGSGPRGMLSKIPSFQVPTFLEKASVKAVSSKLLTNQYPYVQLEETYGNPPSSKVDNILPGLPLTKAVSGDANSCFVTDTFPPTYSDKPVRKIEAGRSRRQKIQSQLFLVINAPKGWMLNKNDNAKKKESIQLTASKRESTATNGRSNLDTATGLDARYRTINHPSGHLDIKDSTINVFTETNSLEDSRYGKQHNPFTSPSPCKNTRSNRSSNAFSDKDVSENRHCNVNNHATDTVNGTNEQQQTANLHPESAPPSLSVGFTEPSVEEADHNVAMKKIIVMPANKKISRTMSTKVTKARKASKHRKKMSSGDNFSITITLTSSPEETGHTTTSASASEKRRRKTTTRKPALSVKRIKAQEDHDGSTKRETECKEKKIKRKIGKAHKQRQKTVSPAEKRPELLEVDSSLPTSVESVEFDSEEEEELITAVEEESKMMAAEMSENEIASPSVDRELIMADLRKATCFRPSLKTSEISLLHMTPPPPDVHKQTTGKPSTRPASLTPKSNTSETYIQRKNRWRSLVPGLLAGMKLRIKGERKGGFLNQLASRTQEFLRMGLPQRSSSKNIDSTYSLVDSNEKVPPSSSPAVNRGRSSDVGHLSVARRGASGGAMAPSASQGGVNRELEQKVKAWKKMMGHVPKSKEGKQKGGATGETGVDERDIHSYQIFTTCQWMVEMEAHSRSLQRWANATKSIFFICFVIRQMRERSFELYLEKPTYLDIADSFNVTINHSSKFLDTVPYKKLSQEGFCLTWEMISILNSEPEERTELQLNLVLQKLQCIPSFCDFPLRAQRAMARLGRYFYSREKSVILREGHVPQNFYFILSGQVVVSLINQDEQTEGPAFRQTLGMLTKGAIFGETAILQQTTRVASVTARTELQLLYVSLKDYIDIFVPERCLDGVPEYITFLSQQSWMKQWPVQLLHENTNKCYTRYFHQEQVIVADSTTSDHIYLIRSGTCQVLMLVNTVTTTWKDIDPLISKDIYIKCDRFRSMNSDRRLRQLQRNEQKTPSRPLSASNIRKRSWQRPTLAQSISRSYSVPKVVEVEATIPSTSKNTDDEQLDVSFAQSHTAHMMMNFLSASQHDDNVVPKTNETEEIEQISKSYSAAEVSSLKPSQPTPNRDKLATQTIQTLQKNAHHPAEVKSRGKGVVPVRPSSFTTEHNVNANMRQAEEKGTETEGTRDGKTCTHTSFPESSSSPTNISQESSSLSWSSGSHDLLSTSTGGQHASFEIPVLVPRKKPTQTGKEQGLRQEASSQPSPSRNSSRSTLTPSPDWKTWSKQSCWAKRWHYLVPERCRPPVNLPVCAPVDKGPPVYVEIVTLKEGDVFGFDQLDLPVCSQPKTHRVSLVSCGAEVIVLKKRFFVHHANVKVQQAVHLATQPYPSPEEVIHEWRMVQARDLWQARLRDEFLLAQEQKRQLNSYVFGRRW